MKKISKSLLALICILCLNVNLSALNEDSLKIHKHNTAQLQNIDQYLPVDLFVETIIGDKEKQLPYVDKVKLFKADAAIQKQLLESKPTAITMTLPTVQGNLLKLKLIRNESFSNGMNITTASGKDLSLKPGEEFGVHYTGTVADEIKSVVTLNIFEDNIYAFIAASSGNYSIMRAHKEVQQQQTYVLSRSNDFDLNIAEQCSSDDPAEHFQLLTLDDETISQISINAEEKYCLRIYVETDYDLFQEQNGDIEQVIYITKARFSAAQELYHNIGIPIKLVKIHVWDIDDPYESSTADALLPEFANESLFDSEGAHIGQLYSGNSIDGLPAGGSNAYLDVLCDAEAKPFAVMSMVEGFAQDPTPPGAFFLHSIFIIAHETGHNIGSPHTHWCGWQGGPIDGCAGGEFTNPSIPPFPCPEVCPPTFPEGSPGTIMSHCNILYTPSGGDDPCPDPNPGIDLSIGFDHQIEDLLVLKYYFFRAFCNDQKCDTPYPLFHNNDETKLVLDSNNYMSKNSKNRLSIFPNPANDLATIEFELEQSEKISLNLHNIQGKRLSTLIENTLYEKGRHQIVFQVANWPAGTYYLRLEGTEGLSLEKIIIE